MKIVVVQKKPVLTDRGRLPRDVPVDVPEPLGKFLISRGDAVHYETKVLMDSPMSADGVTAPLSALDQGRHLQNQMSNSSESGEAPKKRGRPKKEPS